MKKKLIVIAHNIRSVYNVGSFFRTCDAAGVEELIIGGYSPDPTHPRMHKTALGAEFSVKWRKAKQTWREIEKLKKSGYHIVALETSKEATQLFRHKPKQRTVLLLGNEVRGLSKKLLKKADEIVKIPMNGYKESLNVSVAAGIAIYHILKNK
jgi:23S rRNA (guanosine2251-2'-O)-methyltransferase